MGERKEKKRKEKKRKEGGGGSIHCIHFRLVPDYETLRQNLYGSYRILWFIRIKKICCYFLFPPITSSYGLQF